MTKAIGYLTLAVATAALIITSAPIAHADVNLEIQGPASAAINDFINVTVVVNPADDSFNAYDLVLSYDSSVLQYSSFTVAGMDFTTGCGTPFGPVLVVNDAANNELLVNGHFCLEPSIPWAGSLIQFTFQVLADTETSIDCLPQCSVCPGGVPANMLTAFINDGIALETPVNCVPLVLNTTPANPDVDIEKFTNGVDADVTPGPSIAVGDPVAWTYEVTNIGDTPLTNIVVVDDQGVAVSCPQSNLAVGESMTCTGNGIAVAGQYANIGTVTTDEDQVGDNDPSHYFGVAAGVDIEKSTNGQDADFAPGPTVNVGDAVAWTYDVTNTGNTTLTGIIVVDDQGETVSCPATTLAVGESMVCTASNVAGPGQYANIGSVTSNEGAGDDDPSHYFGVSPGIDIEKSTNGQDADVAPGPSVDAGDPVQWDYLVTNTGDVPLDNIAVIDDLEGPITCPQTTLGVGENMTCTHFGVGALGQYSNLGTVTATGNGAPVNDEDPSHYLGNNQPDISIEKSTNGEDADVAPGPAIDAGAAVVWEYLVTNTCDKPLESIAVVDDQEGAITCPQTTLNPGESMTCAQNGIAIDPNPSAQETWQYANVATVTAVDNDGKPVQDSDPSHFLGVPPVSNDSTSWGTIKATYQDE